MFLCLEQLAKNNRNKNGKFKTRDNCYQLNYFFSNKLLPNEDRLKKYIHLNLFTSPSARRTEIFPDVFCSVSNINVMMFCLPD